jgi:hypothetical protein
MIEYQNIYEAYLEANGILLERETRARKPASIARWNKKRQLNDQAYFIMLFAQLEDKINRLCVSLITKKKGLAKWGMRRSWDVIEHADIDRFPFKKRVALLVEKGTTDYNDIKDYYDIRNDIAHGNVSAVGTIIITTVAAHIKEISSRLRG